MNPNLGISDTKPPINQRASAPIPQSGPSPAPQNKWGNRLPNSSNTQIHESVIRHVNPEVLKQVSKLQVIEIINQRTSKADQIFRIHKGHARCRSIDFRERGEIFDGNKQYVARLLMHADLQPGDLGTILHNVRNPKLEKELRDLASEELNYSRLKEAIQHAGLPISVPFLLKFPRTNLASSLIQFNAQVPQIRSLLDNVFKNETNLAGVLYNSMNQVHKIIDILASKQEALSILLSRYQSAEKLSQLLGGYCSQVGQRIDALIQKTNSRAELNSEINSQTPRQGQNLFSMDMFNEIDSDDEHFIELIQNEPILDAPTPKRPRLGDQ